jgi:hypothetical protein
MRPSVSIVLNLGAIIACGAIGGLAGYAVQEALALDGIGGAMIALVVAMLSAALAFAGGSSLLRGLHLIR